MELTYYSIEDSSLREALAQARWGKDEDEIIDDLKARGELEEIEVESV